PKTLGPGRHTLLMDYRGKINTGASGLFASDYQTDDGAHRRLLLTQFESADFRRFAPSWDEPARKAVFQLTLIAPADQSAVSNMPAASVQAAPGGTKKIVFQPTPKMSTYLVFLAVGDLERVSRNVDGTEIGVVARKGVSGQTTVALDAAEEQLRYYNRYFGMKYPLPKLDLIAAPGSGSFGAMENWGAILFFEPYLLADPKTSSESDRQRIHVYLAHEIAHQWFGNLVTMAWWDDLWLNESFASWMENKAIGDLHPGWGYDLVALDARETAMRLDATAATHPIVQPAETLEQVNGAGDAITYEKGASVIRMLEAYVGPDAFRNGVQAYLRANAYGNATREDLWRAVEAAANKPLLRIAKDFTEQAGVPLVRVDPVSADNGAEVVLRQGRFGADQASKTARFWRIPVPARSVFGGETADQLLDAGPVVTSVRTGSPPPVVVNYGQTGYFRTLYAQAAFDGLARKIDVLRPIDQLALVYDSWALGAGGYAPVANTLELISRMSPRAEPRVWSGAVGVLRTIDGHYADGRERDTFRAWAVRILRPLMDRLTWRPRAGESAATPILREELILTLSRFGDQQTIDEANSRFERFETEPDSLPATLRGAVLSIVGEHANPEAFAALKQLAAEANDPEVRKGYFSALARAADPELAQRALALAFTDAVPATLAPEIVQTVSVRHPLLAWRYALDHQKALAAGMDSAQQTTVIPNLLQFAATDEAATELHGWALRNLPAGGRFSADQTEARIRNRALVRAQRLPEIDRWLQLTGRAQPLQPAA
ncbi:MAG: M1 family metallopeptidase, partial [Caulobacteraceae bacterium]